MKTATVLLNGVTVALAATDGAGHTRVDLNAIAVSDSVLSIQTLTDSSTPPGYGKTLDVYYAFSASSFTATLAPTQLASVAKKISIRLENAVSITREFLSPVINISGRYIYIWYVNPSLDQTIVLTVNLITGVVSSGGDSSVLTGNTLASNVLASSLTSTGTLSGLAVTKTITTVGQTGAKTINNVAGRVNIAAAGTSVIVTNSQVTANSIVLVQVATADATARVTSVVPGSGSFTINTIAVTAETAFSFLVVN